MDLASVASASIMPISSLQLTGGVTVKVIEIEDDPEQRVVLQIMTIHFSSPNTLMLVGKNGQAKTWPTTEAAAEYAQTRDWTVVEE